MERESLEVKCAKWVRKIDIPPAAIPAAEEFLQLAGVNDYTIYPDLQGLGSHARRIYGF
jgi:hypothetical protein